MKLEEGVWYYWVHSSSFRAGRNFIAWFYGISVDERTNNAIEGVEVSRKTVGRWGANETSHEWRSQKVSINRRAERGVWDRAPRVPRRVLELAEHALGRCLRHTDCLAHPKLGRACHHHRHVVRGRIEP